MSKWFRLSNGREELIANEDHFKRLLDEGAVEIDDPTAQEPSQEEPEQVIEPDGSTEGQEDPGKPSGPDGGKSKRKASDS